MHEASQLDQNHPDSAGRYEDRAEIIPAGKR